MERSSPLAAMQPPALPVPWGMGSDCFNTSSHLTKSCVLGPNAFNFRDLSMRKPATEYFSLKPVRGSSPTASLAADLSQNFHIDQRYAPYFARERSRSDRKLLHSPALPTPRRSLFTSNLFGTLSGRGETHLEEMLLYIPNQSLENVTTPPLPSSSPGPGNDAMDVSPLPHKAPFTVSAIAVDLQPPTPRADPNDTSLLESSPVAPMGAFPRTKLEGIAPEYESLLFQPCQFYLTHVLGEEKLHFYVPL